MKELVLTKIKKLYCLSEDRFLLLNHGLDILISDGRNIICLFLFSMLFKNTLQAALYLLTLCALRVHTGGWHASSELLCFITYQTMFILFSIINKLLIPNTIQNIIMLFSIIYILTNAPVEHKYNPLSCKERKANYLFCVFYICVFLLTYFLIKPINSSCSQTISLSFAFNTILMECLKRSINYRYHENKMRNY